MPNWGSCSASTLHGNTNGVTAYFFFREVGRGPCPDASQHIGAPGREAAPADPRAMPGRQMFREAKQLLLGHFWAYAKAWGAANAKSKVQLKCRNHLDFPAAERGFSERILDSRFRHADLSLDKP